MPAMTRVRLRLIAGLAVLLSSGGLVAGSALPAAADTASHSHVLTYVALGDSYAAGQATDCTHTASSYPRRLDALHRIKLLRDVTCASATTSTLRATQLSALNPGVKLVTVTVGANDLDLTALAASCTPVPTSVACLSAIQAGEAELPGLFASLTATYAAIADRAPKAEILVTGYPALLSSGPIATAEEALNATVQAAVAAAAARTGADIRYVAVDFTGHTLDSPDPWFVVSGPNSFHPNAAGDRAIADALAQAV
jgi:lysophospholipase L1-like esterase